jgi:hypothetical protein
MTFLTFIYRLHPKGRPYYGKYTTGSLDSTEAGLDKIVYSSVLTAVNQFRKQNNEALLEKIYVGILSLTWCEYISTDSTEDEIPCFDFYSEYDKTYINGKLISNV